MDILDDVCLYRMPPPDLISTWVPTQGDESALGQDSDAVRQQDNSLLFVPVSSLKLDRLTSGMTLGKPVLKKRSFAK
jgi:hypothetical protein